jgi:hypothetical protein
MSPKNELAEIIFIGGAIIKRKHIILLIILILFFSNIAIASNDYISEYGRIREFHWGYLTSNNKYIRFESPEEFLNEVDYYVNNISKDLNKSDCFRVHCFVFKRRFSMFDAG